MIYIKTTVADPGFSEGVCQIEGDANLFLGKKLSKTVWKRKKLHRGRARPMRSPEFTNEKGRIIWEIIPTKFIYFSYHFFG